MAAVAAEAEAAAGEAWAGRAAGGARAAAGEGAKAVAAAGADCRAHAWLCQLFPSRSQFFKCCALASLCCTHSCSLVCCLLAAPRSHRPPHLTAT